MDNELELVFGIISYDDLSGNEKATLYTMNDLSLVHWKETNDYTVEIETSYGFDSHDEAKAYLEALLGAFTKWMHEQGYNTEHYFHPHWHFSEGYNINTHFETIEEVYGNFKLLVRGY